MDLPTLLSILLLAIVAAWWWRTQGVRECALNLAKQHCAKEGVELLDDAMALRGFRWLRDGRGYLRLAREYAFEFTATRDERYAGKILMFGRHLARIDLAAFRTQAEPSALVVAEEEVVDARFDTPKPSAQVVSLAEWRRSRINKP